MNSQPDPRLLRFSPTYGSLGKETMPPTDGTEVLYRLFNIKSRNFLVIQIILLSANSSNNEHKKIITTEWLTDRDGCGEAFNGAT